MAQEREMVPLQTLQAGEKELSERWPVPYAILFIMGVSVGLWSLIIALSRWLVG